MAKILVIDDDAGQRRMIGLILTRKQHDVIEAKDGAEGLRRFQETQPELVVCDIIMPDQEGIQTIREIRALAPGTGIIAISGGGANFGVEYLEIAGKLGADLTLSKPFRPADLMEKVDQLLERKSDPADD